MRKDAATTPHWVKDDVVHRVKKLATDRHYKQGEAVAVFVDYFVRTVRAGGIALKAPPNDTPSGREGETQVTVSKAQNKELKYVSIESGIPLKGVLRLALEYGLKHNFVLQARSLPPPTLYVRDSRVIRQPAVLFDRIAEIARDRGTTVAGLTGAVLELVADNPEVLDAIELPPGRDVPASEAQEEAARMAVAGAASRPRGRPRKVVSIKTPLKRPRGRPRKRQ